MAAGLGDPSAALQRHELLRGTAARVCDEPCGQPVVRVVGRIHRSAGRLGLRYYLGFARSDVLRRRSGRFVSGANFGTLRIEVPASIPANSSTYNFFAWVRGDCDGQVISLKIITHELGDETAWLGSKSSSYHQPVATSEQEAATVRTDTTWVRLSAQSVSLRGGDFLAFAVAKPGAIWLDEVVLEAA